MFEQLLYPVASAAVTSGLLTWLFKEWLSVRLRTGIQHEYDRKLATFKIELQTKQDLAILDIKTAAAREAAFYASSHGSFSEGQKAAMERRLAAIDKLWQCVLQLRNGLPAALQFTEVMTVEQYTTNKGNPQFPALASVISAEDVSKLFQGNLEQVRPYIGEYVWAVFDCYQTLLLRVVVLLTLGRTDAEKIEWYKDPRNKGLLKAVLSSEELGEFESTSFLKLSWIKERLESKLLAAVQKIITGETFGKEALEQARLIELSIAENKRFDATLNRPR